jgi:hypothetical protein
MKSKNLCVIILLGVVTFAPGAQALTFGFAADDPNPVITTPYEGFIWSGGLGGASWVNGSVLPLTSAPNASLGYAWSNDGTSLSMQLDSSGTFTLNSLDLFGDAAANGGIPGQVTIEGFLAGVEVDSFTTPILDSLSSTAFTEFTLDFADIDTVTLSESGAGDRENILVTDVTIEEQAQGVPEPGSFALLASGLLGFGLVRRRRRQVAPTLSI